MKYEAPIIEIVMFHKENIYLLKASGDKDPETSAPIATGGPGGPGVGGDDLFG